MGKEHTNDSFLKEIEEEEEALSTTTEPDNTEENTKSSNKKMYYMMATPLALGGAYLLARSGANKDGSQRGIYIQEVANPEEIINPNLLKSGGGLVIEDLSASEDERDPTKSNVKKLYVKSPKKLNPPLAAKDYPSKTVPSNDSPSYSSQPKYKKIKFYFNAQTKEGDLLLQKARSEKKANKNKLYKQARKKLYKSLDDLKVKENKEKDKMAATVAEVYWLLANIELEMVPPPYPRYKEIIKLLKEVLKRYRAILPQGLEVAQVNYEIGSVYRAYKDHANSANYFGHARQIYRRIYDDTYQQTGTVDRLLLLKLADTTYQLGKACVDSGEYQNSLRYLKQARKLYPTLIRDIKGKKILADIAMLISVATVKAENVPKKETYQDAIKELKDAEAIYNNKQTQGVTLLNRGNLAANLVSCFREMAKLQGNKKEELTTLKEKALKYAKLAKEFYSKGQHKTKERIFIQIVKEIKEELKYK
ncbi:MAG: tetratricopeptide repeat protein [Bacteroidota bacterium]